MSVSGEALRRMALALPDAVEQDHHGMPSFRVRGRIYATVPDEGHVRIMVGEHEIRAAVAEHPDACEELSWGKRLACVVVDLERASAELVTDLLGEAWATKAPASLVRRIGPDRG